ncbi:MAG: LysE family transporter [Nitrososphaerota archaeon]
MTLLTALVGLGMAFSLAAPPGPMNALIASAATVKALKGTVVGLGAVTADAIFLVLVLLLHGHIPSEFFKPVSIVGAFLLIFIAYKILNSSSLEASSVSGGYLTGLSLGLTNPFQIGWWLTVGLAMVYYFGLSSALGFFTGLIIWIIAFPYFIWRISTRYGPRIITIIRYASAVGLIVFAIYFIYIGLI